tara:strand:+ start:215 stop:451 length:237 start_codon:yes stop_codon:yes gene_type:complete
LAVAQRLLMERGVVALLPLALQLLVVAVVLSNQVTKRAGLARVVLAEAKQVTLELVGKALLEEMELITVEVAAAVQAK